MCVMSVQAEQLTYWIVAPANRPWTVKCQKLVANEVVVEFRQKGVEKPAYSVTLSYEEAAALRQAMWWVEHIEPSPSTI